MPIRSLSQRGLNRLPKNPKQRPFTEGGGKVNGTALDALNESLEHRQLHPTKGFRTLGVKRGRAQHLVAHILAGGSARTDKMRRFLQHGY